MKGKRNARVPVLWGKTDSYHKTKPLTFRLPFPDKIRLRFPCYFVFFDSKAPQPSQSLFTLFLLYA